MAQQEKRTYEKAVISGKAYWQKLNKTDEYSGKYQLDIGNIPAADVKLLESKGVKLKEKEGHPSGGPFVVARTTRKVPVMDVEKNNFDVDNIMIGNGSSIKAKISFNQDHPMVNQYGTSLYLNKVQVISLVEYSGGDDDSDFD